MSKEEVIILDCVLSPFCNRVKIALNEKGVSYESKEEDLFGFKGGKSELLLKSNPIYKKVPVLLHNGKPLNESSIIVNYIDETWPSSSPLLPSSPYKRAQARFWIDYIDKKVFDVGSKIWKSNGEEQEAAKKELIEILKQLEEALGDKDFFGGESFGIVDVIAIPFTSWFYAYEKIGNFKVEEHCPKLSAWEKRCLQKETVASVIPCPGKIYHFLTSMRKNLGLE
ncbi:glutathione S-transferase 3-like [Benincasa hispida]|uniref:glutathione S-transferase 3-like n=1 Tax=Benincasa hispida TaxID=102211 RepID=UPI0019015AF8|nr:glutathione S-transferase 3-like [Benincasa hispida]